ncbi:MAG: dephospho-CoA kinase [Alphaproteobacteria bacterium]
MVILGLTGSIGMGKTVAAGDFARLGVPVFDSDHEVHALLGPGGAAVAAVGEAFEGVAREAAVDRAALGRCVFGDAAALARLEDIVHPLVRARQRRFLRRAGARRSRLVVLDVPLLFETGGERRCDYSAVVTAPAFIQRQRVLERPGMSEERLAAIRAHQMPEAEKLRRADFVIATGLGRRFSLRRIHEIVKMLSAERGRKWP